jgi:ketosteroid isomerase-like protein
MQAAVAARTEREILETGYRAFDRNDFDAVLGFLHPEIVWVQPAGVPEGGTMRGRREVGRHFSSWAQIFGDFGIRIDELVENWEPGVWLARVRVYGRGRGSGAALDMPFAQAWRFEGGHAVHVREFATQHPQPGRA